MVAPSPRRCGWSLTLLGTAVLSLLPALVIGRPLHAEPVICTTTLEAPLNPRPGGGMAQPVEVSRCGSVQSTGALLEQRFYSYTAPYARGVDLTHQITDLLGLAMGGGDGTRLMGFGFPEQTIIWDGSALQAATEALLQRQSTPIPWRTADLPNGYGPSGMTDGSAGASGAASTGLSPNRSW